MKRAILEVKASLAFVDSDSPGAGLFVSEDALVTCGHVAKGRVEVVSLSGPRCPASVDLLSEELDLALLRTLEPLGARPARICHRNKGVGTEVAFLGFPFPDVFSPPLAMAVKTMIGNRYVLDGVEHYVVDAMTAEGFSGSPLFLESGEVCGMLTSRFDPLRSGTTRSPGGSPVSSIAFALTSREILRAIGNSP